LVEERTNWAKNLDLEVARLREIIDERTIWAKNLESELIKANELVEERTVQATNLESELIKANELVEERTSWARNLEFELQTARENTKAHEEQLSVRFHELAILAKTIVEKDEELKSAKAASFYQGASGCCIEQVRLADAHEQPPHNHLNVDLTNLRNGNACWESLRVRIVEHHGRPGLAIFKAPDGISPLKNWVCSGKEEGSPFMLIVPGDTNGDQLLNEACGMDFCFLQFLVAALENELNKSCAAINAPIINRSELQVWLMRARSLRQKIDNAGGSFLRHGQPQVHLVSQPGSTKDVLIDLPDCYFDGRFFPVISFNWKSDADILVFPVTKNPLGPFLASVSLRALSLGSAIEVRFESGRKKAKSLSDSISSQHDIKLAKAIVAKLPQLLESLPSSFQRNARRMKRSFLGEKIVKFNRKDN
jgi:hypothetical protein